MRYLFTREGFMATNVRKILQTGTFLYRKIHKLCPKAQKHLADTPKNRIL